MHHITKRKCIKECIKTTVTDDLFGWFFFLFLRANFVLSFFCFFCHTVMVTDDLFVLSKFTTAPPPTLSKLTMAASNKWSLQYVHTVTVTAHTQIQKWNLIKLLYRKFNISKPLLLSWLVKQAFLGIFTDTHKKENYSHFGKIGQNLCMLKAKKKILLVLYIWIAK